MHSSSDGFHSKIAALALGLAALATWLLLRGYHGLLGDAQLYAFQALAKIHPWLASDLYLQNTSQDQFTIFSPMYAWFIDSMGLEHAARSLTLLCTIWLLAAAWGLARILSGREAAWLTVIALLIIDGSYGGSSVFRFSEPFLTARLPAEALIVTSFTCYFRGLKPLAFVIAATALLVHPLIALPGLLLLICLSVSIRAAIIAAIACALTAALVAGAAAQLAWMPHLFPVMDSAWLNVVEERSQFLFLQLWSFRDWKLNVRPFFYLAFTALALQDARIRRLCMAAGIVGITGLAISLIASMLGPVAVLVQGQAWRWVWVATFVSALLLPATILPVWHDKRCGPLCVILLISGLTVPAVDGTACASLALILWLTKSDIPFRAGVFLRWMFFAMIVAVVVWTSVQSWEIVTSAIRKSGVGAAQVREIFALKIPVVLAATIIGWCIQSSRSVWVPSLLSAGLFALSIFILPAAFKQSRTLASVADITEFSDWQSVIPQTATVFVTPARDVGAFVWFTLQRPNYLAVDQSAGVVFSRKTALEIQRRSQILLPVSDPNWKILTHLRTAPSKSAVDMPTRPLTTTTLSQICADSQLEFVISPQDVGFDRLPHSIAGPWMGWNLYDCRKVRAPGPTK
jgi:hypothetical protein